MRLLLLFILVPLIEIALFIQAGKFIGLWPTLIIVILTAILGTRLVKSQGLSIIRRLQDAMSDLKDPTLPLVEGAMVLFSGALLLTPGFFTDAVGLLLLVPAVRQAIYEKMRNRISFKMQNRRSQGPNAENIVEGEYREVDPVKKPTHVPSEWTKH
ncbi:FxsA family protein [Parasulfitobacter algicola]|uniref:FxsA family protein n=1 Tax=Parasulfitobacter algicola TaxID=2614809 RepID=A0ABX2IS29_9RHOB|nr:FxsA family protein [Sulfitobacter algicola]NSX53587.1 FxsA family protein [Sulfitobacter algicola]